VKSEKLKVKSFGRCSRYCTTARAALLFSLFTIHFSLFTAASAQDDPAEIAPPPVKVISKAERERLNAETDIKDRTKLSLELMAARLTAAEKLGAQREHDAMFRELGGFHGLMDDGLNFLLKSGRSGKVLDNLKRLEIGLRMSAPRIEVIRRDLPLRYEDYLRKLMKYVREARTKASEPLFSDSVVRGSEK